MEQQENGYLRINQLIEYLNMGRSTIWSKASDPTDSFPSGIKLSDRVTVWKKNDIENWVNTKVKRGVE